MDTDTFTFDNYTYFYHVPFDFFREERVEELISLTESVAFDFTLLSPQGIWGVVNGGYIHSILGGPKRFIQQITARVPEIEEGVYNFIEYYIENDDLRVVGLKSLLSILMVHKGEPKLFKKQVCDPS